MSPMLQSRLLRVLEEREVRRGGDNVPIYVNVRVLAATNEPLEERIKEGTFREDLYYRLNVIPITLPSLRERGEDTPLLVAHFLKDKTHPRTGQHYQMTREAMEVLLFHDWPGNVREAQKCHRTSLHALRNQRYSSAGPAADASRIRQQEQQ